MRDITSLLSTEKANIYALESRTDQDKNITHIQLSVEVDGLGSLSRILTRMHQIQNVIEARRQLKESN